MKFRVNPNLTSFSLCNEIDCVVTHDRILELPTDLYEYFNGTAGCTSVEDIIHWCETDDEFLQEFELDEDTVAEVIDVILGHTEDYLEDTRVHLPAKDKVTLSNFDDEIEIYESDGGDFADIPDED